jgi:hypothetical protein
LFFENCIGRRLTKCSPLNTILSFTNQPSEVTQVITADGRKDTT